MVQAALEARRMRSSGSHSAVTPEEPSALAPVAPAAAKGGVAAVDDDEPSTLGSASAGGSVHLSEMLPDDQRETELNTLLRVPPPPKAAGAPPAAAGVARAIPTLQSPVAPMIPRPLPAAGRPAELDRAGAAPAPGPAPAPPHDEPSEDDGPMTVIKTQRMDVADLPRHFHLGNQPAPGTAPASHAPLSPPLFQGVSSSADARPAYPGSVEFPNAQTSSLPQVPLLRPPAASPPIEPPPESSPRTLALEPPSPPDPSLVSMPQVPMQAEPRHFPPAAFQQAAEASHFPPPRAPMPALAPGPGAMVLKVAAVMLALSALLALCFVAYVRFFSGGDAEGEGARLEPGKYPEIEAKILLGGPPELEEAEREATQAKTADPTLALALVRARALRVLDGANGVDLEGAVSSARALDVRAADLAFAELAAAVGAERLDETERLLAEWGREEAVRSDPFFQYVAGAALERLGQADAVLRFQAALGAEPRMLLAEVRLVRALLLYADADEGARRAAALAAREPGRAEVKLLGALAWIGERRRDGAGGPPGALPAEAELPRALSAALPAIELVTASDPRARQRIFDDGIARADVPALAAYYGELALELGEPRLALRAADRGLALVAGEPRSLSLLGRSAIETGQLDRITQAIRDAPRGSATELEVVEAYEKGDYPRLSALAAGQSDEGGGAAASILARHQRMKGVAPLSPEQISRFKAKAVVGGDLVIADAHLDAGDLAAARRTIQAWRDPADHPLRALRYARLLRYERKLDEARRALEAASPTRPAQIERVLLEAETPEEREHALAVLGPHLEPERPFFEAYLRARDGDTTEAAQIVERAAAPPEDAPRSLRLAAALAYGELGDLRRGEQIIRTLMVAFPNDPDVIRAAVGLRLLPRSRLEGEP